MPLPSGRLAGLVVARLSRALALLFILLAGGFLLFSYRVSETPPAGDLPNADAIVALTGGEDRIAEAVRLLAGGKARRLLISGVNPVTNKPELISQNSAGRSKQLFRCCIDLGKRALNTQDNALETTEWVRERGFRSLIVVTSNYHMPRALIELRQAMPDVELYPYPVRSPKLERAWWTNERATWVLIKEYLKFVTAYARFTANAVAGPVVKPQASPRLINANAG